MHRFCSLSTDSTARHFLSSIIINNSLPPRLLCLLYFHFLQLLIPSNSLGQMLRRLSLFGGERVHFSESFSSVNCFPLRSRKMWGRCQTDILPDGLFSYSYTNRWKSFVLFTPVSSSAFIVFLYFTLFFFLPHPTHLYFIFWINCLAAG